MKLYLNDHIKDFDLEAGLSILPEQRREQALKFKYELGRRTCVAAYLLLCKGLEEEYGIFQKPIFEYGEHGKPMIVGLIKSAARPDIEFIRYWTMKEAFLKRSGEGLRSEMGSVLVPMPKGLTTVVSADKRYVYSICV